MPQYLFRNVDTNEVREVFQKMNDEHVYFGEDNKETNWVRIFTIPTTSIDSSAKMDPFSSKDFIEKTNSKKGTVGDMMDLSKELSQQRSDKLGTDPIKQKYFDQYAAERHGKRHYLDTPKVIEQNGIKITRD